MKQHSSLVAALALGLALSSARDAHAGANVEPQVTINTSVRTAQGSLGTAHNSGDNPEHIGCALKNTSSTTLLLTCEAKNLAGQYVLCQTNNPSSALVQVFQSISGDSFLWFAWDSAGHCTQLDVTNSSRYAPKR